MGLINSGCNDLLTTTAQIGSTSSTTTTTTTATTTTTTTTAAAAAATDNFSIEWFQSCFFFVCVREFAALNFI